MLKSRLVVFCLAVAVVGCEDGSASVTLKGRVFGAAGSVEVNRQYSFGNPEAAPDFNATINSHVATYTESADAPFDDNMTLTLYLGQGIPIGPFDGQASINSNRRGTAIVGNIKGVVEKLEWTGSSTSPISITGTFEGNLLGMNSPSGQEELTASDGRFVIRARCDDSQGESRHYLYCGGGVPTKDQRYGEWIADYDTCPANVRDALLGSSSKPARREGGRLVLAGRAGSLGCVATNAGKNSHCGRNFDEEIDGCKWRGLLSGSGNDGLALVEFHLRSDKSCEGGPVSCYARFKAAPLQP